jgi:1-acyl-sn-glycerol-3-phosphate acyltransferase
LGERIRHADSFFLAIAPEGTRKAVKVWKRGFYHIAKAADVPIILGYMDYQRKVVGVGPVFYPGPDITCDMNAIADFYSSVSAKYPHKFLLPV